MYRVKKGYTHNSRKGVISFPVTVDMIFRNCKAEIQYYFLCNISIFVRLNKLTNVLIFHTYT